MRTDALEPFLLAVRELPAGKSKIEARLHVNDDKYWLTDVKRVP